MESVCIYLISLSDKEKVYFWNICGEKAKNMIYILKDRVNLNITGKTFNHTIVNLFKPKVYNISN